MELVHWLFVTFKGVGDKLGITSVILPSTKNNKMQHEIY